jgi:hypothetical protein
MVAGKQRQKCGLLQGLLGINLENGEELFSCDRGEMWIGMAIVKKNGFLQTIKVCVAVWALFHVPFERAALGCCELGIELLTNVVQNVVAANSLLFHAIM